MDLIQGYRRKFTWLITRTDRTESSQRTCLDKSIQEMLCYSIDSVKFSKWEKLFLVKGGEGSLRSKFWKLNFEIIGDPISPLSGSTFWLGFEVPDTYGCLCGHALFRPQQGPKHRKWRIRPKTRIFRNQSIDNSLLKWVTIKNSARLA